MNIVDVVARALKDEKFGEQLKAKAEAAFEAGVDTDEWTELMKEFAESPAELARLRRPGSHGGNSGDSATSVTSKGYTFTTTTTTTRFASPKFVNDFMYRDENSERRRG